MREWLQACRADDVELEDVIRFDHAGQTLRGVSLSGRLVPLHGGLLHPRSRPSRPMGSSSTTSSSARSTTAGSTTGPERRRALPACIDLQTYEVKVEGGFVYIRTGGPDLAEAVGFRPVGRTPGSPASDQGKAGTAANETCRRYRSRQHGFRNCPEPDRRRLRDCRIRSRRATDARIRRTRWRPRGICRGGRPGLRGRLRHGDERRTGAFRDPRRRARLRHARRRSNPAYRHDPAARSAFHRRWSRRLGRTAGRHAGQRRIPRSAIGNPDSHGGRIGCGAQRGPPRDGGRVEDHSRGRQRTGPGANGQGRASVADGRGVWRHLRSGGTCREGRYPRRGPSGGGSRIERRLRCRGVRRWKTSSNAISLARAAISRPCTRTSASRWIWRVPSTCRSSPRRLPCSSSPPGSRGIPRATTGSSPGSRRTSLVPSCTDRMGEPCVQE